MITFDNREFLEYMPDVRECDRGITALNDQWNNMELLCEINCPTQADKILPNMKKVQGAFFTLQQQLIDTLIAEVLNKTKQRVTSKAQVAIDILIRNLYERTADVGFIATDDDIRRFVCQQDREQEREYILNRLQEYVAKYSVYEEIILLDTDRRVLLHLNPENPISDRQISDPLLDQTLSSAQGFTETFRATPLQANQPKAHIFSCKVMNYTGEAAGIVCLCFRFEDEVKKIFRKLATEYDGSVIFILDDQNTVIASSDENHVPLDIQMETGEAGQNHIIYYRGVEYLIQTTPTTGYQGYFGLGWKGCMMLPLRLAFRDQKNLLIQQIASETLSGLMSKADSFSRELKQIVLRTQKIQHSLKQIVFNGQILAAGQDIAQANPMRPILQSIGRIGVNTSALFEKSIQNLFATVITGSLQNASFVASLCVDIMDRNLYERSDDCRWWALNPLFRATLTLPEVSEEDRIELTKILAYVNSLYTVYSNLFLFDRSGRILAVSNPKRSADVGRVLSADYIRSILGNHDQKNYFVSPFEPTDLYDGRPTYVYGASITAAQDPQKTIGGIGIVFDSEFQFQSMLRGAIESRENSFAVFTDRDRNIISSTSDDLHTGDRLDLPAHFFTTPNGQSCADVLPYRDSYYAIGCACSASYREYKSREDAYQNDVLAFVFDNLSETDGANEELPEAIGVDQSEITLNARETHVKLATFVLNQQLFALEQSAVLESTDAEKAIPFPCAVDVIKGAVAYGKRYLAVVDARKLLGMPKNEDPAAQLLILQLSGGEQIALEVDSLNNILEVNESDLREIAQVGEHALIRNILYFQGEINKVILLFHHDVLIQKLSSATAKEEFAQALRLVRQQSAAASPDVSQNPLKSPPDSTIGL